MEEKLFKQIDKAGKGTTAYKQANSHFGLKIKFPTTKEMKLWNNISVRPLGHS